MNFRIWDNYRIGPTEAADIDADSIEQAVGKFVDTDMHDDPAGYFEFYGNGRELIVMDTYGKKHRIVATVNLTVDIQDLARDGLYLSNLGDGDWTVEIRWPGLSGLARKVLDPLIGRHD